MFVARRRRPPLTQTLYILELEGGNYYVGITGNFARRMEQHFSGKGSAWTRLHPAVRVVHSFEVDGGLAQEFERNVVAQMVLAYGAPCVRGAGAARPGLSKDGARRERLSSYRLHE